MVIITIIQNQIRVKIIQSNQSITRKEFSLEDHEIYRENNNIIIENKDHIKVFISPSQLTIIDNIQGIPIPIKYKG